MTPYDAWGYAVLTKEQREKLADIHSSAPQETVRVVEYRGFNLMITRSEDGRWAKGYADDHVVAGDFFSHDGLQRIVRDLHESVDYQLDWKRRAEDANEQRGSGSFTLNYAGFAVSHTDVRALLILARALQAEDSAWHITLPSGGHFSAWVPGMTKKTIPQF